MQADFATLVLLSYNRSNFIFEAIESLRDKAGYPFELIVVDDGSSSHDLVRELRAWQELGRISTLVTSVPQHNEGVGHGVNVGFHIGSGDPLVKLDQDLLYTEGWLARAVGILDQDRDVGMLGFFKYHHQPVEWDKMKIEVPTKGGYHYTRQFCGSGFAIPREVWQELGPLNQHSDAFCEDSEFMDKVRTRAYELALPDVDLVTNRGFGIGPSTVVEEGYKVHEIHHGPFVTGQVFAEPANEPVEETYPVEQASSEAHPMGEATHESEAPAESEKRHPPKIRVISPDEQGPFEYDWTLPPEVVERAKAATDEFEVIHFNTGVVITTCAGREDNLERMLRCLAVQERKPRQVVVICDGCSPYSALYQEAVGDIPLRAFEIHKHGPGQEQPRNVGFRKLREIDPKVNYVWFLDSDLVFPHNLLQQFYEGWLADPEPRILIGPYDWMAPGETQPHGQVAQPDYRWVSFLEHGPEKVLRHDLGAGLANFGGNLIWPVEPFQDVGGFHPELHHGRCEDGELGLRAASAGIPMSFVRDARAWHVYHPVDGKRTMEANARDVPLINQIHPWVEEQGLVVTQQDGARFEWCCPTCSKQVNSLDYWKHSADHQTANF